MKKNAPIQYNDKSVSHERHHIAKRYPSRHHTLIAAVLASFLLGEELHNGQAAGLYGTVRLRDVVRTLENKYHWPINRRSFVTQGSCGRRYRTVKYSLSSDVISSALADGGHAWIWDGFPPLATRVPSFSALKIEGQLHLLNCVFTNMLQQAKRDPSMDVAYVETFFLIAQAAFTKLLVKRCPVQRRWRSPATTLFTPEDMLAMFTDYLQQCEAN